MPSADVLAGLVARLRAAGCVFAEDEAALLADAAASPTELAALVARRVAGEPLEPLIGWAEFGGLRIAIDPGVFVPRRRTELLVHEAARLAPERGVVVDLCCGSGAAGAAVRHVRPDLDVYAADVDPAAVACARRNLPTDRVFVGDLFTALPAALAGRVDVLVVNAPYVPTHAIALMPPEARLYEPLASLDGGADGLDVQRRVIAGAAAWLAVGAAMVIEASRAQAPLTAQLMTNAGLDATVVTSDELDGTAVIGRA